MPIGIQRLNAPRPQPSSQVIFIKPLPGPTMAYAQDFLERIAAISHPIMKANHLSIMTLEEHEPNPEFIGRNFNAGEIIQLVLKAPYTGHWLNFRSVQMVMMHELAHCVQMNHGRAFWSVNNQYKSELKDLWAKGYTGDGLWGRGQTLLSGAYDTGRRMEDEILPANLCGGTFRSSRRRKRKRNGEGQNDGRPKETYAEAQQRRIAKKFGVNGQKLGDDEQAKIKLEIGKKPKGKPRVAGSARGRELRAAAALARSDQVQEDQNGEEREETLFEDSGSESEEDQEVGEEAIEIDGSRIRDGKGRAMFKVCDGEDQNDANVKREIEELRGLEGLDSSTNHSADTSRRPTDLISNNHANISQNLTSTASPSDTPNPSSIGLYDIPQYVEKHNTPNGSKSKINIHKKRPRPPETYSTDSLHAMPPRSASSNSTIQVDGAHVSQVASDQTTDHPSKHTQSHTPLPPSDQLQPADVTCPICSMANDSGSLLCIACSHVLDTDKVTEYWRCSSEVCKGSEYINAADCGLCGVCGARREVDDNRSGDG